MKLILKEARLQLPQLPGEMGELSECHACPGVMRGPLVPEDLQSAKVIIIGRNPSARDLRLGQVLSPGTAHGAVVEAMIKVMGLTSDEVYFSNALHCRTPRDRIPLSKEVRVCATWKSWELNKLYNAKFIITLGADATKQLLDSKIHSLQKIFWDAYEVTLRGRQAWLFPCIHPRHVLQNEDLRNPLALWCDAVGRFIEEKS